MAFEVFNLEGIKVEMLSQGASKVNISFVIADDVLERAMKSLHSCYFEDQCIAGIGETVDEEKARKKLAMDTPMGVV